MTIDTLDYATELEAAGVDRKQAQAHARALKKAVDTGLATKPDLDKAVTVLRSDIAGFRAELKADITGLRAELKGDIGSAIAALELRLIKYMIVQAISIIGLVLAIGTFVARLLAR